MNDPVGKRESMADGLPAAYTDVASKGVNAAGMALAGKYPKQG